jgi:putative DNA methylase
MAIVAEGARSRIYLAPCKAHESSAQQAQPDWFPPTPMPNDARAFTPIIYGFGRYGDLFTPSQLVALTTFSDLVHEAIEKCRQVALVAGTADDCIGLGACRTFR